MYSMSTQLRQLLDLITKSIETLETTCAANGTEVPDLQSTFSPASEAFRSDPVASEAADIINAAALQLSAIVALPQLTMFNAVGGVSLIPVSVQVDIEHHTALQICSSSRVS